MKNVPEIRYDLALGIEGLNLDSTLALVAMTDSWAARARLRQRWIDRNDPELGTDLGRELPVWPCLVNPNT